MPWRRIPFPLAVAAIATVSACSASPSSSTATPSTAPTSTTPAIATASATPPTTSATPPTTPGATPTSTRVGLLTEEFTTPLPADPARAKVVTDFEQGYLLWDKSQENFALVPPVTSWVTGSALNSLKKSLAGLAQVEEVPAGIDRLFKTAVTALSGSEATLTTCDDGSKFKLENPRTHAIDTTPVPLDQQYLYITWAMTRLSGHWAIKSLTIAPSSSAALKSCLP